MRLRSTPKVRRTAIALVVVLLGGSVVATAQPVYEVGSPLSDALRDLQDRGLRVFFTSNVVRPEMRVVEAPSAETPRQILNQLLAPHGLTTTRGPGGRLVVVEAEPAGIRGTVRDARSALPLAGAQISLAATQEEVVTSTDGSFLFPAVEPGTHALEAHLPGYVIQRIEAIQVQPHGRTEVAFVMEATLVALDEIVVTPSRVSLLSQEPVAAIDLDREDILALPHLGDDVFRAFTLLPGVSGEEASARFNVRGGRDDEVLILLDEVELFEPYHLKDYSSAVSIVPPRALEEVNVLTGGFPAQYGDRMSGVLDMKTISPEQRMTLVGLSVLNAELSGSGTFAEARGGWLASLRRSVVEHTLDLINRDENPKYWDALAKADFRLRPQHLLTLHFLHANDSLDHLARTVEDVEDYLTSYQSSYLWFGHQGLLSDRLFVDSVVSAGRVQRDRRGSEADIEDGAFSVRDERRFDFFGLEQDWNYQLNDRSYLRWGFEARSLDAAYDYENESELEDVLAPLRPEPRPMITRFRRAFRGEQYGVYLSDRLRPWAPFTVELGLRYDHQTLTGDDDLSPRLNLVYALGKASTFRLAWGLFHQSQRPYELQVPDGETSFSGTEQTEQRVIGFDHTFSVGRKKTPLLVRLEAYQREVDDPRPRFENLFEPISEFPEIEHDRFRITPESSRAYGVELLLKGSVGDKLDWWVSYAYARSQDRIDGRYVPRRIDQPHTFSCDLNYRLGAWNLNLAWRYHTGWPITAVSGQIVDDDIDGDVDDDIGDEEDDEGEGEDFEDEDDGPEIVPVFGPINGERLSPYHRLDLRASREWKKKRGVLGFFIDIQNVYDRGNLAGLAAELDFFRDDGSTNVSEAEQIWGAFQPSFGITWQF